MPFSASRTCELDRIKLRTEQPEDESVLFSIYAGTRHEELELTGWDAHTREQFLRMQFQAMRHGYREMYPRGEFSMVLLGDQVIGRQVIDRSPSELRLVDMALLPEFRGRGIGTKLLKEILAEAARSAKTVRIMVLVNSRPMAWYERHGFVKRGEAGIYQPMEWHG